MKTVLIAGAAGKIGRALGCLASRARNVILYDTNLAKETEVFRELALNRRYLFRNFPQFFPDKKPLPILVKSNGNSLEQLVNKYEVDAILSAVPHSGNQEISQLALQRNIHYLDMTEDVRDTVQLRNLLTLKRSSYVIPNNGIAPGFVSILGKEAMRQLQESKPGLQMENLTLRVGALPRYPTQAPLWYASTWSPQGMVNQCVHPCVVVRNYKLTTVPPLTEYGRLLIDGIELEEFTTSGGIGTLGESLQGQVKNIQYRTLRYPGHCKHLKFLLETLQLQDHTEELIKILGRILPIPDSNQDVVYVHVTAQGRDGHGRLHELTIHRRILPSKIGNMTLSAIETATASATISLLDLLFQNKLIKSPEGFCKVEDAPYPEFMQTHFARMYISDVRNKNKN